MGGIEELDDDAGLCAGCKKAADNKCTNCRKVYYCGRDCQKRHWKQHKFECKALPYKVEQSPELGKYLVAARDLRKGEVIFSEPPLVVGPVAVTVPVCLNCYTPVDGSYKCRKSGWPLCGPKCEKAVEHNAEVVIPHQTEGRFEIDDYTSTCYLYECVGAMRTLLMQKTAPKKFKKIMSMVSHTSLRKSQQKDKWAKSQADVVDVMKKTLGVMVFEALCPQYDLSDATIHEIVGIFETNSIEIRLAMSEINGIYETGCLMEHSCVPNVNLQFDDKYNLTTRAGRNISKGEHLGIMYTHCLWGTQARREHLFNTKMFWCQCERCQDPTEFGTNFSTLIREGKQLRPENPLDQSSPWSSPDKSITISAAAVSAEMQEIGSDLALLQLKGTIEDYTEFLDKYEKLLHPNHYHMVTAKHSLMQMLGRTDGCLIQDMPEELLRKKESLCRQMVALCEKLDPSMVRLQIYAGAALFELHLPLLQYGKRQWETGNMPTDEFRKTLYEPRDCLKHALELLQDETHDALPEGQLRLQIKDTLAQLEQFMKTLGCEDI